MIDRLLQFFDLSMNHVYRFLRNRHSLYIGFFERTVQNFYWIHGPDRRKIA